MKLKDKKRIKREAKRVKDEINKYGQDMPARWGMKGVTFMEKMKRAGYKLHSPGVCYGLSSVAIHAVLTDQFHQFNDILYKVRQPHLNPQDQVQINSLFNAICCLQDPDEYPHLYPQLSQTQNIIEKLPLVMSKQLENNEGIKEVGNITGTYTLSELEFSLGLLRETVQRVDYPIALLVLDNAHAIMITFNKPSNQWQCVDLIKLPVRNYATDQKLAEMIGRSLTPTLQYTVIGFKLFVSGKHESSAKLLFDQLFTSPAWENCHALQYERKLYFKQWFLLSVQMGCYKETKQLLVNKFDPNSIHASDKNPLSTACEFGHHLIVLLLLSFGAKIQSGTPKCYGALFQTKNNHQHGIAQLLESKGATLTEAESTILYGAHQR